MGDSFSRKSSVDEIHQRFVVHRTAKFESDDKGQMHFESRVDNTLSRLENSTESRNDIKSEHSRWSDETEIAGDRSPEQQPQKEQKEYSGDRDESSTFLASENSSSNANARERLAKKTVPPKSLNARNSPRAKRNTPVQKRSTKAKRATPAPRRSPKHQRKTPSQPRDSASRGHSVIGTSINTSGNSSPRDMPAKQSANQPEHKPEGHEKGSLVVPLAPGATTLKKSLRELHSIVEKRRTVQPHPLQAPRTKDKHDVYDLLRQRDELQTQLAEAGPASDERSKQLRLDMRALNVSLAAATSDNVLHKLPDTGGSGDEWTTWARDRLRSRKLLRTSNKLSTTFERLQSTKPDEPQPSNETEQLQLPNQKEESQLPTQTDEARATVQTDKSSRKSSPLLLATLKLRRQYGAFIKWKNMIAYSTSRLVE